MQIDWITVAAQIANFLVLIWLLQRFLYAPITQAMARREARIASRLDQARTARSDAEDQARALADRRKALDDAWDSELHKARLQASALRATLEQQAREDMRQQRQGWLVQSETDRAETLHDIRLRLNHQVFGAVDRVLSEFADTRLGDQIAARFVIQIETLDADRVAQLKDALKPGDAAVVTCSHTLPPEVRSRITRAIHKHLSDGTTVTYGVDSTLLIGIMLTLGRMTVEWSAHRHLSRLETALDEAIEAEFAEARR